MFNWKFVPTKSIGDIQFGMKRAEVRALFSDGYKEFRKTSFSNNTTDDFNGFHVYYDDDDKVEAVEIFEGINIEYEGKIIFPIKIEDIPKVFEDITIDDEYYTHIDKSIGYTTSDGLVEGILVGNKGYYE